MTEFTPIYAFKKPSMDGSDFADLRAFVGDNMDLIENALSVQEHEITDIVNLESTLAGKYSTSGGEITGAVTITNAGDMVNVLKFNIERPWTFKQKGISSGAELIFSSDYNNKTFRITSPLGVDALQVRVSDDVGGGYINSPQIKEDGINLIDKYALSTHHHDDKYASSGHQHEIAEIANLELSLAGKYSTTGGEITGAVTITNKGDLAEVLKLNIDRSWTFKQVGVDSASQLHLVSDTNSKYFKITSPLGIVALEVRAIDTFESAYIDSPNLREGGVALNQKYVQIDSTGGTGTVSKLWSGTQEQYDILDKDPNTIYYIIA